MKKPFFHALVFGLILSATTHGVAQTTYWLPTKTETETERIFSYDTKAPAFFADWLKKTTAIGGGSIETKSIDGKQHQFIKQTFSWKKPLENSVNIEAAESGKGYGGGEWVSNSDLGSEAEVIAALKSHIVSSSATYARAEILALVHNGSDEPNLELREPISEVSQRKARMRKIGDGPTHKGKYFPDEVQIPAEIEAMRREILAVGNLARRDADYRKDNKVANNLSSEMTTSLGQNLEKIYKDNPTPPYFDDLVMDPNLNEAAQYMAEYYAKTDGNANMPKNRKHDAPGETWKGAKMDKVGDRAGYFAPGTGAWQEGLAGAGGPDMAPETWMKSETHYRPWFNINGKVASMGIGVAKTDKGWYFCKLSGEKIPDGTEVTKVGTGTVGEMPQGQVVTGQKVADHDLGTKLLGKWLGVPGTDSAGRFLTFTEKNGVLEAANWLGDGPKSVKEITVIDANTVNAGDGKGNESKLNLTIVGQTLTIQSGNSKTTYKRPTETVGSGTIGKATPTTMLVGTGQLEAAPLSDEAAIAQKEALPKIVSFCTGNIGKKVGNGECWTLADEAFKSADIKRPGKDPRVWGREVLYPAEDLLPGDIVEIEAAKFGNGMTVTAKHTSVIVDVGRGEKITVCEQNINGDKTVQKRDYDLAEIEFGSVKVYRYEGN